MAGSLLIVFTSDGSVESSGFVASYRSLASFLASSRGRESQDAHQPECPPIILHSHACSYLKAARCARGAFCLSSCVTAAGGMKITALTHRQPALGMVQCAQKLGLLCGL